MQCHTLLQRCRWAQVVCSALAFSCTHPGERKNPPVSTGQMAALLKRSHQSHHCQHNYTSQFSESKDFLVVLCQFRGEEVTEVG